MRRQTHSQGLADRWQAAPLDVNPFQLPARFALSVQSVTGRLLAPWDHIFIQQRSIAIERKICGARVAAQDHAIDEFVGVAIRIDTIGSEAQSLAVSVNLHHDDPELCIPLHVAFDLCDASARWQSWGRALGLPLLLPADDGTWREPVERLGRLVVDRAYERNYKLGLKRRRSITASLRKVGAAGPLMLLDGNEIIARR